MWILFNNRPFNIFDIKNVSSVTKIDDTTLMQAKILIEKGMETLLIVDVNDETLYLTDKEFDANHDLPYSDDIICPKTYLKYGVSSQHTLYPFNNIPPMTYEELIKHGFENVYYFTFNYGERLIFSNYYNSANACQRKLEEFLVIHNKIVASLPTING